MNRLLCLLRFCCTGLGRGLAGLCAFALLCMAVGNGQWYLESAFYWVPAFAGLALLATVLCLAARSWRWAICAGICLIAHTWLLTWACAPWQATPAPKHEPNLRLLLANVYFPNESADALLELIRETDPDIVLLQEVQGPWAARLAPLEPLYAHHLVSPRYPNGGPDLGQYWRTHSDAPEELAASGVPGVATRLHIGGVTVRVVNVHTAAPFTAGRAARYYAQMRALEQLAADSKDAVILAGDFNSSPWSPCYLQLLKNGRLRSTRDGFGLLGSWPSFFGPFRSPLDHVLISNGIEVISCRVGPGIGSDHRPLIVELFVPEN